MIYRGHEISYQDGGYTYAAAGSITFETYDETMQDIDQFEPNKEPQDDVLTKYGRGDNILGTH